MFLFIINLTSSGSEKGKIMNIEEFESQYRDHMDRTLNELQTAVLLLAQVQNKISEIGNSIQNLSQSVEEFIMHQKTE
jgi:hypothetical protein